MPCLSKCSQATPFAFILFQFHSTRRVLQKFQIFLSLGNIEIPYLLWQNLYLQELRVLNKFSGYFFLQNLQRLLQEYL